jgi:transcriptional regulator with XRE-family HTH domain
MNGCIALRVRARRKALGLSLEALADVSGVGLPILDRLERRGSGCPAVDLWRIAETLGVSITELCLPAPTAPSPLPTRSFAPGRRPMAAAFRAGSEPPKLAH